MPLVRVPVTHASLRAGLVDKARMRGHGQHDLKELHRAVDLFGPTIMAYIEDLFLAPQETTMDLSAALTGAIQLLKDALTEATALNAPAAVTTFLQKFLAALEAIAPQPTCKAGPQANGAIISALVAALPQILSFVEALISAFKGNTTT
jgi:hypothetical protein